MSGRSRRPTIRRRGYRSAPCLLSRREGGPCGSTTADKPRDREMMPPPGKQRSSSGASNLGEFERYDLILQRTRRQRAARLDVVSVHDELLVNLLRQLDPLFS